MNEDLILRLVNLVNLGRITVEQILDAEYKAEVKKRINK